MGMYRKLEYNGQQVQVAPKEEYWIQTALALF